MLSEGEGVEAWWKDKFNDTSADQEIMLRLLRAGAIQARADQMEGRSPDTCSEVRRSFAMVDWPLNEISSRRIRCISDLCAAHLIILPSVMRTYCRKL